MSFNETVLSRSAALAICSAALLLAGCAAGGGQISKASTDGGNSKMKSLSDSIIVREADGVAVDYSTMIEQAAVADFVLIGEVHDNGYHHKNQARIIRDLAAARTAPIVVFEMIDLAAEEKLNANGGYPTAVTEIRSALKWDESGWPEWPLYEPVFAAVIDTGAKIKAAGLPRATVKNIAMSGDVENDRFVAGLDYGFAISEPARQALLEELAEGHCGMMPEKMIEPMARAQRARDAAMARSMIGAVEAADPGFAVLVAGSGHTQKLYGVPLYLSRVAAERKIVAIGEYELDPADGPLTAERARAELEGEATGYYDYIIFTPKVDRDDPCEGLRKMMEHKKKAETERE